MDVVQTRQCLEVKLFINYEEKVLTIEKSCGGKFAVGASTACKKVKTAVTDESLFRLLPLPGHGARVLPLK